MTARRWVAALVALLAVWLVGAALPGQASASAPAAPPPPVVVVGVPGLRWQDVSTGRTPALRQLAARGALGALSIRSGADVTCPGDGWVMLGAGDRAVSGRSHGADCPGEAPPVRAGPSGQARLAGLAALDARNRALDSQAEFGALAGALAARGQCVTAVGPDAALGAARPDGTVARYAATLPQGAAAADLLRACPVTLVAADVASAGRVLATVSAQAPDGAVVMVVGLAETGHVAATHLHVALVAGPGFNGGALRSGSTRRAPYVQVVDVAPTVLALRGVARPAAMTGQPMTPVATAGTLAQRVDRLVDLDRAAQASHALLPWFLGWIIGLQLLGYGVAGALRRRRPKLAARVAVVAALAGAAAPLGSYLVQATGWWRAPHPVGVAVASSVAVALAVTAVAVAGPWRRSALGPPTAVAVITAGVLAGDIVAGSPLQMDSVFGYSPIVAGRFVGFGNVAFGVFASAALLAAAGLAAAVAGRGRPAMATVAAAVGAAAVVVDGAPPWGSDFGGALALVPAAAVLVLLLLGARLSWWRVAGVAAAAVAVVVAFALIDYARPPSAQTHLGRFAGEVLHGGGWPVVRRKAHANIALLTNNPANALVPFVTAGLGWLVFRPRGRLTAAQAQHPTLRAGLVSVVVMAVIGFFTNDSGDAIPAMAILVSLPYAVAVLARVPARRVEATAEEPSVLP